MIFFVLYNQKMPLVNVDIESPFEAVTPTYQGTGPYPQPLFQPSGNAPNVTNSSAVLIHFRLEASSLGVLAEFGRTQTGFAYSIYDNIGVKHLQVRFRRAVGTTYLHQSFTDISKFVGQDVYFENRLVRSGNDWISSVYLNGELINTITFSTGTAIADLNPATIGGNLSSIISGMIEGGSYSSTIYFHKVWINALNTPPPTVFQKYTFPFVVRVQDTNHVNYPLFLTSVASTFYNNVGLPSFMEIEFTNLHSEYPFNTISLHIPQTNMLTPSYHFLLDTHIGDVCHDQVVKGNVHILGRDLIQIPSRINLTLFIDSEYM
jgi:hypothetical protein